MGFTGARTRAQVGRARGQGRSKVVLGLAVGAIVTGLSSIAPMSAGAAPTMKANEAYAAAQLVKLSNLPHGWQSGGSVWKGTSADGNSSSMLTFTQYPDLSTCMGTSPPLSVTAAEANSLLFNSKDQSTNVYDVADVYASAADAKSDYPPLTNPKFMKCFIQVEGSGITSIEQSEWDTGTTFGAMTASLVKAPKYGDQSSMIMVQVPVTLPQGGGTTTDFFSVFLIRQGRSTAELFIDNSDVPPPATLTKSLAKLVTTKMKAPPPKNTIIQT